MKLISKITIIQYLLLILILKIKSLIPQIHISNIIFPINGLCELENLMEINISFRCINCQNYNLTIPENFSFILQSSNNIEINCTVIEEMNNSTFAYFPYCFIKDKKNETKLIINRTVYILSPDENQINKTVNSVKVFNSCIPRLRIYEIYFKEEGYCIPLNSDTNFYMLTSCETCNENNIINYLAYDITFYDKSLNKIECTFPFDIISDKQFNLTCSVVSSFSTTIIFVEIQKIINSNSQIAKDIIFEEKAQVESKIKLIGCYGYNILYIKNITFLNYCENILSKNYLINLNVSCIPCDPKVSSSINKIELIDNKNNKINLTCNFPQVNNQKYFIVNCYLDNYAYPPLIFPNNISIQGYKNVYFDSNIIFQSKKGNIGPKVNRKITKKKQNVIFNNQNKGNFTLFFNGYVYENESLIYAIYNDIFININNCDFYNESVICFPNENLFKIYYGNVFKIYVIDGCDIVRDSGIEIEVNNNFYLCCNIYFIFLFLFFVIFL